MRVFSTFIHLHGIIEKYTRKKIRLSSAVFQKIEFKFMHKNDYISTKANTHGSTL